MPSANGRELRPPLAALIRHETRRLPRDARSPSPVFGRFRSGVMKLRRAVLAVVLAVLLAAVAVAVVAPAARADGDPGSDVLVYQSMFVAADAGVSVQQQVALGNLLDVGGAPRLRGPGGDHRAARRPGRGHRAVGQAGRYASFLGIELSLAYKQRLLVVMPDGFGFSWPGHPAASAYRVLANVAVGPGGSGLATAAEAAVRALAAASGTRLPATPDAGPPRPAQPPAAASAKDQGPARDAAGHEPAVAAASGVPVPLIVAVVLAALAAGALAAWLAWRGRRAAAAWRSGRRRWRGWRPAEAADAGAGRGPAPGYLAGGLARGRRVTGIVVHAVQRAAGERRAGRRRAGQPARRQPGPRPGDDVVAARRTSRSPTSSASRVAGLLPREGGDPDVQ